MNNRNEIETALDNGKLFVCISLVDGRFWKARRNGKTQTWKTRPDHFSIPVKAGLCVTGRIAHFTDSAFFRIEV